jgi:hypothetical protein
VQEQSTFDGEIQAGDEGGVDDDRNAIDAASSAGCAAV